MSPSLHGPRQSVRSTWIPDSLSRDSAFSLSWPSSFCLDFFPQQQPRQILTRLISSGIFIYTPTGMPFIDLAFVELGLEVIALYMYEINIRNVQVKATEGPTGIAK
jgi:hypothetical protein